MKELNSLTNTVTSAEKAFNHVLAISRRKPPFRFIDENNPRLDGRWRIEPLVNPISR